MGRSLRARKPPGCRATANEKWDADAPLCRMSDGRALPRGDREIDVLEAGVDANDAAHTNLRIRKTLA